MKTDQKFSLPHCCAVADREKGAAREWMMIVCVLIRRNNRADRTGPNRFELCVRRCLLDSFTVRCVPRPFLRRSPANVFHFRNCNISHVRGSLVPVKPRPESTSNHKSATRRIRCLSCFLCTACASTVILSTLPRNGEGVATDRRDRMTAMATASHAYILVQ